MALQDYEEALKSFIHDDDKLVTYKWFSKELEIHVNVAKDILKQYWEKHKDDEKIVATFLLIGQLKDRSIRIEVVKESNLNAAKSKFINVDCEHLYSLQKSLQDIELLAFAGEGDLRYSAIKCNDEYVRNDEEIEGLRYIGNIRKEVTKSADSSKIVNKVPEKQILKIVDFSSNEKPKAVINKKDDTKIEEKSDVKEKSAESSKHETKTEKKVSPTNKSSSNSKHSGKLSKKPVQSKQSGFNSLFGKLASKPQSQTKPKNNTDIDETEKNVLDNGKAESKRSVEKDLVSSNEKEDKKKDQEEGKDKKSQEKENRNRQSQDNSKSISKTNSKIDTKFKTKKDKRGKKRNRSQEDKTLSKRKRIVVMDSSEDESDKSNNEEEEEEPMEVEDEPPKISRKRSPSPPAEKRENGKRMVRKTIDKTFKDEDGYLVTKRVHIYEAVSDDEEPEQVKKEEPQKPKPVEVKAKTKQTTLTNFFKKS